jgi:hypothetical protein
VRCCVGFYQEPPTGQPPLPVAEQVRATVGMMPLTVFAIVNVPVVFDVTVKVHVVAVPDAVSVGRPVRLGSISARMAGVAVA